MSADPIENIGCEKCTEPDPVWTKPYLTDDGFTVFICDECGRAKIETVSETEDKELWSFEVCRDDQGRFTSPES